AHRRHLATPPPQPWRPGHPRTAQSCDVYITIDLTGTDGTAATCVRPVVGTRLATGWGTACRPERNLADETDTVRVERYRSLSMKSRIKSSRLTALLRPTHRLAGPHRREAASPRCLETTLHFQTHQPIVPPGLTGKDSWHVAAPSHLTGRQTPQGEPS